jgi:hypothetical protein
MTQPKYTSKRVEVLYNQEKRTLYLVACFLVNKITAQEGYVLYLADYIERWEHRDARPLINALFFKSPEEAFEAGQEILRVNPQAVNEIIEREINA